MSLRSVLLVAAAAALLSTGASANNQTIQAKLSLTGMNNSNISTAFTTTDVFDTVHSCSAGSG